MHQRYDVIQYSVLIQVFQHLAQAHKSIHTDLQNKVKMISAERLTNKCKNKVTKILPIAR